MKESNNISEVTRDDMAFFNSVLSYGIYTDREWMLGLNEFGQTSEPKSFKDTVTEAAFALYENDISPEESVKRNYELYISAYIKNNFTKTSLNTNTEVEFTSEKYGYKTKCQFQESDYNTLNNLARAGYFLSDNADGTKNLHLVFRGTDNKARDFMEFVGKAYLDMSAYYDAFKPLEEEILKFAKNPANNIKTLHVSGHSLGGAMVQEFFNSPEVKASGLDMVGFTYGAPGTKKKALHDIATETFYSLKKSFHAKTFSSFANIGYNYVTSVFFKTLPIGLAVGNSLIHARLGADFSASIDITPIVKQNIFQYEHKGDLIPKLGAAAYDESGHEISLKDVASKNSKETFMLTGRKDKNSKHKFFSLMTNAFNKFVVKPINFIRNAFKFEYHDMMRYVVNIEHKIGSDYNKENSPYFSQFMEYKERFNLNTNNKQNDLIYKRVLEKQENLALVPPKNKHISVVKLSPELQEKMHNINYLNQIQTTNKVVSDILSNPFSYDVKNFSLETTDGVKTIETAIPDFSAGVLNDLAKNKISNTTIDSHYPIKFEQSIVPAKNILDLRKKFLQNDKKENKLII